MNKIVYLTGVLSVVVAVMCAPEMNGEVKKKLHFIRISTEECQASEKASDADMKAFREHTEPSTQEGKCMIGCFFEKMGIMEGGAFSKAKADEVVKNCPVSKKPEQKERLYAANVECEEEIGTGTDRCETGVKIMKCYTKLRHKKPAST